MTVAELMEQLAGCDPSALVLVPFYETDWGTPGVARPAAAFVNPRAQRYAGPWTVCEQEWHDRADWDERVAAGSPRMSVLLAPEGQPSAAVTGPEQLLGATEAATR